MLRILLLLFVIFFPARLLAYHRIVSLDLCTDWLLAKYAGKQQVAGLSPMADWFPVAWIGNSWPRHNGSLEQILSLKPDLVTLVPEKREELTTEGGLVLKLPKSISDVQAYEKKMLSFLGLSEKLATRPDYKKYTGPARSLLILGANGIGTGRNTFENELIHAAGWKNYLQTNGYVNLNLEKIILNPPDAILWTVPAYNALANQFAELPALLEKIPKQRWIHTEYWRWQCPGPWSWQLVNELKQWQKK